MSRKRLKSFIVLLGLVVVVSCILMIWRTGRIEAASSRGSYPVYYSSSDPILSMEPRLEVRSSPREGGNPAHFNMDTWEVVLGILQNTQGGRHNNIKNVFQPLDPQGPEITPLIGSMPFQVTCSINTGFDTLRKCEFSPDGETWPHPGQLQFVVRLASKAGDVVEGLVYLDIAPGDPCASEFPPAECPQCQGNPVAPGCPQCLDPGNLAPECPQCQGGSPAPGCPD